MKSPRRELSEKRGRQAGAYVYMIGVGGGVRGDTFELSLAGRCWLVGWLGVWVGDSKSEFGIWYLSLALVLGVRVG